MVPDIVMHKQVLAFTMTTTQTLISHANERVVQQQNNNKPSSNEYSKHIV